MWLLKCRPNLLFRFGYFRHLNRHNKKWVSYSVPLSVFTLKRKCATVVNVKVKMSTSLLMSHRIPSVVLSLSLTFWAISFLHGSCNHGIFLYAWQTCRTVAYLSMKSASVPVLGPILYNWSDTEWQRSMLAPDKLNTISFIHDNYTRPTHICLILILNEQQKIRYFSSDLVYAFSSNCPLFLK